MIDFTDPQILSLLVAGAFAGGFINGLASFGTALFTLGFWLQILPPIQAVALIMVLSVTTGLQSFMVIRKTAFEHKLRIARFILPGLFGIPLGIYSLNMVETDWLRNGVGMMLISYGLYVWLKAHMPQLNRHYPLADIIVGFTGGVLGGLASLSGAIPSIWVSLQNWPKYELRAVLQSYNLAILGVSALILFSAGVYSLNTLPILLIALPVSIFGEQIGLFCFRRLKESAFRTTLVSLMFISGIVILIT